MQDKTGDDERPSGEVPAFPLLRNSDAHCLEQLDRSCSTLFRVKEAAFGELKLALQGKEGREVLFPWQGNGESP